MTTTKTKTTPKKTTTKKVTPKKVPVKKEEKKIDLKVKCSDCGTTFERSVYSVNQKFCNVCAKKKKLDRIKIRNKWKRRVCSTKRFMEWAENNKITKTNIEGAVSTTKGHSISKIFAFYKENYPKYLTSVEK